MGPALCAAILGFLGPISAHIPRKRSTQRGAVRRGMSRPCRRGIVIKQEATPPRLCVLRYRANQAPNPAQNSNIAAQYSTHQPNHPLHTPPTLQKCSTRRVNVTHPSSVLRFLRFSGRHKPHQPDIAAHTASGRDEVARVRHGQSRWSDAGPSWGLGGAGPPRGRGRAKWGGGLRL